MAFRNIIIENPAHISLKNESLIIKTTNEHLVPIEDISALLIESKQSTITTAALSRLGQGGCAVFFCDEKHSPCSVLQPFSNHSRALNVLKKQLEATEPFKKRLWQIIIKAKIANQAECLNLTGNVEPAQRLSKMIDRVNSGDTDNVEATAAQIYFRELFGNYFTRSAENGFNSALDYGYAILRGCISRNLAVYGFTPSLGIHHKSELNSFNLADDLIEPFRPIVDLAAFTWAKEEDTLTPVIKRQLFNLLNYDIIMDNKKQSVSYAIELMVKSLSSALANKTSTIKTPTLIALNQHSYE